MKLALGTVQFGLDYGVANTTGQVSSEEIARILDLAHQHGVDMIDTAAAYGDSEMRLGHAGVARFKVVSKLPPLADDVEQVRDWVKSCVEQSLHKLGIDRLYGLLLHKPADLAGEHGPDLYAALQELKTESLVDKVGISIYGPWELDALAADHAIDLVQAPFNAFDRRLEVSGWLDRLKHLGVEVHTRSAFLQGLLLMPAAARPAQFNKWMAVWRNWHSWLEQSDLTPLQGALGVVGACSGVDRIVVGVDDTMQLRQIISAAKIQIRDLPQSCISDDLDLIDPSKWEPN